jgi:hydrogenase maturation protease
MMLAIALGNAIRADDGVGFVVARALAAHVPGVEVIEANEALPEHAEAVAKADRVVFLDASVMGPPGEVKSSEVAPLNPRVAILHALTPEEVLGIAHATYGRAPPAALVTIAGSDFSFSEGLSPEVEAAIPQALRLAYEFLSGR